MSQLRTSQLLEKGWSLRETGGLGDWLSVAKVPTSVQLDLMNHKLIPDPFIDLNEISTEWVGKKSWTYRVDLPPISPSARGNGSKIALVFEGLDTFAHVRLNGETLLETDNMFLSHQVDITNQLQDQNQLEIDFGSALLKAREIRAAHPEHKWEGFNADLSRLAVRKAQYNWGWDWGPVLMTAGPWRPVRLETYHARIEDIRVEYRVNETFSSVQGTITVPVQGTAGDKVNVDVEFAGKSVFSAVTALKNGVATVEFSITDASLWYPHGYGSQALYTVRAVLNEAARELDSRSQSVGFREVQLMQEPDEIGQSFYFRVNGVDLFCGGADWIPADSFLTNISEDRYRQWLKLMVDGNQVMVRVWGGGIYEDHAFYNACDELGLLVWQDFMFACGNYPIFPAFLESVHKEAVENVRRLRHHACLAIWAGNNEDYQVQEQSGLEYNYEEKNPQMWLKSNFPARYIYEKILPEVVQQECPSVPYHPGSPWGEGKITSDQTVGDMHQWNVWHGTQEKYQIFETLGGRFNSEFGMEAYPNIQTIEAFVTQKSEMYPQSHILDFHNKADGHERRLATYVVENFRLTNDLEKHIHLTQLVQADALMYAYRGWRRQWGQEKRCGGALVWQINDCWPGTSWAIVDYYLRRKAAYYALSRVLAPIAVGVQREHHDWSVAHARPAKSSQFQMWVVSSQMKALDATVKLRFICIETGEDIKPAVTKKIQLVANGTTEVLKGVIDNISEKPHALAANVVVDGTIVSRDVDWPQPYKYLSFADRGVVVRQPCHGKSDTIRISAKRPTKGLMLEERERVTLSDNAIDLVPGDEQVVQVSGLSATSPALKYHYLDL